MKHYCTKALSDQASSLTPDWILIFQRPRIPASFHGSTTTFHLGGLSGILQDKVRMLGAPVLCSPSEHVFYCTLLTLWCTCVNEWHALREKSEMPCSSVPWWPHTAYGRNLSGVYTDLPMPISPSGTDQRMGKACRPNSFLFRVSSLFGQFITSWEFSQFSSVTQLCLILCDPMNRSTLGLPVHHQLPEFTQTHVHQVGDAIQWSHPLSSPSPAPNPSQHQDLFQWVNSSHEVAKVLEFQLQCQSFQWTPRTDLL